MVQITNIACKLAESILSSPLYFIEKVYYFLSRRNYVKFVTGATCHSDRGKLTTQVKILQQKRKNIFNL